MRSDYRLVESCGLSMRAVECALLSEFRVTPSARPCDRGAPSLRFIDKARQNVRCLYTMSLDLNTILKDWPHESGSIKVRKIAGLDGREKLQLRVDLGVLQMEMTGRPDGRRPHNCESLLEYYQKRAARAGQKDEAYQLTPEQCAELQQEGIQYYHRYLSLFQINDFEGVVRDTQRNLDLFSFVAEHTNREEFSWALQQFRPYVLMMNTRAKASILLGQGKFAEAIGEIEHGREVIVDFLQQSNFPELVSKSSEIAFLDEWLEEVKAKRPRSKLEIMQREMEIAIAKELYERAAELRDAIKLLKTQKSV
jgi:tetratricopeptide (TPR) repeat protein